MSKVLDILYKKESGGNLIKANTVEVSRENGISGDYHGKSKTSQITILSKESWENANKEIGTSLPWTARRSNLFVEGIDFKESIGKLIGIGTDVVLKITGECKPCSIMEKTQKGLYKALEKDWRGGVETIVLKSGKIKIDDDIFFI